MNWFGKPDPRKEPKPPTDPIDEAVEEMRQATSKVRMDFGLDRPQPEKVTIQVLQQLIREQPERMAMAVRRWLRRGPS